MALPRYKRKHKIRVTPAPSAASGHELAETPNRKLTGRLDSYANLYMDALSQLPH
jgi:hypothetical protein